MKPPDRKSPTGVIPFGNDVDAYVTFRKIVQAKPLAVCGQAWFVLSPIFHEATFSLTYSQRGKA